MKLPERKWFGFEQLAERWKVHSDLIYHYVESGQLKPSFAVYDKNGHLTFTDEKPSLHLGLAGECILLEEVQRFEAEHMGAVSQTTGTPPYLDPDNPHYAPELAAAVNAWMGMYKQGKLPPGRVPTEDIRTWLNVHLKEYVHEPSKGMIDRIVTVVNPAANKAGGAIPTEKN
jgi:hypothetical protein